MIIELMILTVVIANFMVLVWPKKSKEWIKGLFK